MLTMIIAEINTDTGAVEDVKVLSTLEPNRFLLARGQAVLAKVETTSDNFEHATYGILKRNLKFEWVLGFPGIKCFMGHYERTFLKG